MSSRLFTPEQEKFIEDNLIMYTDELAEKMNKTFDTQYSANQISTYKKNRHLKSGLSGFRRKPHKFQLPEDVKAFLLSNYKNRSLKDLTTLINTTFGSTYTEGQIKRYKASHRLLSGVDTRFQSGHVSHNKGRKGYYPKGSEKTWFKKGNIPKNHKSVGSERVDKDGYTLIKVAEPSTWRLKHRQVWEEANGPIPNGHCVIFLDGDKSNITLDNLALLSKNQLKLLNSQGLLSNNPELTKIGITLVTLQDLKFKRKRGKKCSTK